MDEKKNNNQERLNAKYTTITFKTSNGTTYQKHS